MTTPPSDPARERRLAPVPIDARGSFAWQLDEPAQRASVALAVDGGCLVVDPVDVAGLDDALASLGPVVGVVSLLDRHGRDSAVVAARTGAPRLFPRCLGGGGVAIGGVEERSVTDRRGWHEALLWIADSGVLVCVETLGTAPFFLAREGDRLGMHPLARIAPPRAAFDGLAPRAIAVGHGPPLLEGAADALATTLRGARRSAPRAWLHTLRVAAAMRR